MPQSLEDTLSPKVVILPFVTYGLLTSCWSDLEHLLSGVYRNWNLKLTADSGIGKLKMATTPDSKPSWRWRVLCFLLSSHTLFLIPTHQILPLLKQDGGKPVDSYPKAACRLGQQLGCHCQVAAAGSPLSVHPGQLTAGQIITGEFQMWGEPPSPLFIPPSLLDPAYPFPPISIELCGRNFCAWKSVWLSPTWSFFLVREKSFFLKMAAIMLCLKLCPF